MLRRGLFQIQDEVTTILPAGNPGSFRPSARRLCSLRTRASSVVATWLAPFKRNWDWSGYRIELELRGFRQQLEPLQFLLEIGVLKLGQRLFLNLAYSFSTDAEFNANFIQRLGLIVVESVA